ncbi:MAG: hypothetical protein FWC62_09060 [Firmicutes bacterium]|nr:hypothetical protein [Bacillota bacterium]
MSYIDEIFARLNLQQIQSFLLYGEELVKINPKDYQRRIDEAWASLSKMLKEKFPEQEEYEKIVWEVYAYASATENIHMEIGLKCGAVLEAQLLMGARGEGVP